MARTKKTNTISDELSNDVVNDEIGDNEYMPEHYEKDSCVILVDSKYNIVAVDCEPSDEYKAITIKFKDLPMEYNEFCYNIDNYYLISNEFINKNDYNNAETILTLEQKDKMVSYALDGGVENFLMTLSDEKAAEIPMLYDKWENFIGKSLKKDTRVQYDFKLWKVLQNINVVLENQPPSIETASLYTVIDVAHKGTIDDPIPANKGMEYVKGKYYIENDEIYLMNRQGMEDGQTIILQYLPSELVGQYFEKIEK